MEIESKKKWPVKYGTRYEKLVVMTHADGAKLEELIAKYGCANLSQLCKKIVRDELELQVKG